MHVTKTKAFEVDSVPEQLIYNSIKKYIANSKFPKTSILRKLKILENKVDKETKKVDNILIKGRKTISALESNNFSLQKNCAILIEELKNQIN